MRADRLLRIVFRLQGQGVVPASVLARDLEVSPRTIQRDMDALSAAGVPVYSVRGGSGGWALLPEYRTNLTGLSSAEALAVVVGQSRGLLADLGLDDPGEDLIMKLLAAVAPTAREHAEHARQRIHVDHDRYWEPITESPRLLPQLLAASWDDKIIQLRYGSRPDPFAAAPYGLVRKGTRWYLVGHGHQKVRMYRVSRIHELSTTNDSFTRPSDFDLASYWRAAQSKYAERFSSYRAHLRLRGDALIRADWVYARSRSLTEPDSDGWVDADFDTEDWDGAIGLVGGLGGSDVIVISPDELRQYVVAGATRILQLNHSPTARQ